MDKFEKGYANSSLNVWWNLPKKHSGLGFFSGWKVTYE
jgi:hypothetical protein